MPIYHHLGKFPEKRHTTFFKNDGTLHYEQLFGTEGFHGMASLLYHLHRPTMVKEIKAIKDVSTKQFCALSKWTKENPDFQNNESKQNYYTHTLVAIANNKEQNEEKIIRKLCTSSYIKEED